MMKKEENTPKYNIFIFSNQTNYLYTYFGTLKKCVEESSKSV